VSECPRLATARLALDPIASSDLSTLAPIFADAAGWWYDPGGRHLDTDRTARWIETASSRWSTDGLSYWTVRLADAETVIGVGGAQRHASRAWNLYYRLARSAWGHGYATELARAAITTAREHDDQAPVIAWVAEHNHPSRRVAEHAGLTNQGLRVDTNDGRPRLAYADRTLP
jgi:RimJ/RimL family protein N-acetyltransferase